MQNKFQVVVPQSQQTESGRNVLFISDLPQNVTESDLWMFFDEYKDKIMVININTGLKYPDYLSTKLNSAKVIFKEPQVADEARKAANMKKIKGKTIRVMWDERDNSLRYNNHANLFVKNIPFDVKPREFYEYYLAFGDISSSKMPEGEDGNHMGYGYINYYNPESAAAAIKSTDGKDIWGSKLDVKYFQKKNERFGSLNTPNSNIYMKNFPISFSEKDLVELCSPYGEVTSCKLATDEYNRRYAIISYKHEESPLFAKNSLNGKKLSGDSELFVDLLMNKQDRKKILSSKIMDSNYRLNELYKFCNLHIRNVPYNAKEEDLREAFSKFGEIKSVKIDRYMLVTKVNNELKEIPTSKGFGYVCFETPEAAREALDSMNQKFLPNFETWKRPLLVDYFMPKHERTPMVVNKINQIYSSTKMPPPFMGMTPMMNNPTMTMNPNMMNPFGQKNMMTPLNTYTKGPNTQFNNRKKSNQQYNSTQTKPQYPKKQEVHEKDEIDYNYLNSLDYDSKKDYLGELIFKKIENHKLAQSHSLPIDTIGKITGMILGIEDISEIIDIYKSNSNLTSRITEALDLIAGKF